MFVSPEVGVEGVFEAGDGGEAAPAVAVEDVEDWSGAGSLPRGAYGGMYISHSLSSSVDKVLDADDRDVPLSCGLGFPGL